MDIFVTILRIYLLILTSIVERLYLHTNTWRLYAGRAIRGEKKVPYPVPLYTWVVPLNQLRWPWVPCLKLQVQVHNALCIYDFDKLLFKLFLQIHSTVTVSMGLGIQPWEKREVCPLRFVKSTRWGTCLQVAAFTVLQWNALLPNTAYEPSSIPGCVRPPSSTVALSLIIRLGQGSLGETGTACLKCKTSQNPIQNRFQFATPTCLCFYIYLQMLLSKKERDVSSK